MTEICKDIDQGLASLNKKIDSLNAKLRELERRQNECCKDKDKGGKEGQKPTDLTEISKRISAIENYINKFDSACQSATSSLQALRNIFNF